jgi:hypothetical protein
MAYVQMDGEYRPRSKKLRDQKRRRQAAERLGKRIREKIESMNNFPSYTVPERNTDVKIYTSTTADPIHKSVERKQYRGEMAERERIAQEEIERKKKCVAPAYNKGAYQPVFNTNDAKWIGK